MRKMKQIVATVLLATLCVAPLSIIGHSDGAYWHETYPSQSRYGWMDTLSDTLRLDELNIPGTNDSLNYVRGDGHLNALTDANRSQTTTLEEQLYSGIRAINLQIGIHNGHLRFYDNNKLLVQDFPTVMRTLNAFVESHPTESIFVHLEIKKNTNVSTLTNLFNDQIKHYRVFKSSDRNPMLGDMRGQIVFMSTTPHFGENAVYPITSIQDDEYMGSNWDLYSKWLKVKNHANEANASSGVVYLNYLNGSGHSFPYFVASGHTAPGTNASRLSTGYTEPGFKSYYPDFPRVNRVGVFATIAFEGTNTLLANYITNQNLDHVGFVMADFPGKGLINTVIAVNK